MKPKKFTKIQTGKKGIALHSINSSSILSPHQALSPEQLLWLYVILTALNDYKLYIESPKSFKHIRYHNAISAHLWIHSNNTSPPSIIWVANLLFSNPSYVIKNLRKITSTPIDQP